MVLEKLTFPIRNQRAANGDTPEKHIPNHQLKKGLPLAMDLYSNTTKF
jgi:hypothetical protein